MNLAALLLSPPVVSPTSTFGSFFVPGVRFSTIFRLFKKTQPLPCHPEARRICAPYNDKSLQTDRGGATIFPMRSTDPSYLGMTSRNHCLSLQSILDDDNALINRRQSFLQLLSLQPFLC